MIDKRIISDWMKVNVISTQADSTVRAVAGLMIKKKIGTLPIVEEEGILIGLVTMQDILQIFLPDAVALLKDVDFIKDFGALRTPSADSLETAGSTPVTEIMRKPISVEATSGLMRALSVIHKHNLPDLPVTREGKLVGIASRVDIGRGFLADWQA